MKQFAITFIAVKRGASGEQEDEVHTLIIGAAGSKALAIACVIHDAAEKFPRSGGWFISSVIAEEIGVHSEKQE